MENNYSLQLSKKLSYLLRHGAVKEGLNISPDGYILLDEILSKNLRNSTVQDIENLVALDPKQRYNLRTREGCLEIKANQGHTIAQVSQLSLTPVYKADFDVIHGTYFDNWKTIREQGLSRMKRIHIHFAKGLNFTCGLRHHAEVLIYVDLPKAVKDNVRFFESENGVILSPGNENGVLLPKYFTKVVDRIGNVLFTNDREIKGPMKS